MPASAPPVAITKSRRDKSKALALSELLIADLLTFTLIYQRSTKGRLGPLAENPVLAKHPTILHEIEIAVA
jgi:hypothetical protein